MNKDYTNYFNGLFECSLVVYLSDLRSFHFRSLGQKLFWYAQRRKYIKKLGKWNSTRYYNTQSLPGKILYFVDKYLGLKLIPTIADKLSSK